jgi:hypothetical protein
MERIVGQSDQKKRHSEACRYELAELLTVIRMLRQICWHYSHKRFEEVSMTKRKDRLSRVELEALSMLEEEKQRWRDQVIFDRNLSGLTKAVAYAMANWMTATGTREHFQRGKDIVIWGTQRALAEMVGCSAKTVHLATVSLIERGHMTLVHRQQGRDDTNRYRIISWHGHSSVNRGWVPAGNTDVSKLTLWHG